MSSDRISHRHTGRVSRVCAQRGVPIDRRAVHPLPAAPHPLWSGVGGVVPGLGHPSPHARPSGLTGRLACRFLFPAKLVAAVRSRPGSRPGPVCMPSRAEEGGSGA